MMGRHEESLEFLKDGQKNNPDSAQIYASLGGSYYRNKNIEEAVLCLERARALWLKGTPPNVVNNEYMVTDRLMTYDLLGYIYETRGQYEKALEVYTEYERFGLTSKMDEKIIKLKNLMNAVE
jgi:tetratricopeptide (TPR) repeat protein